MFTNLEKNRKKMGLHILFVLMMCYSTVPAMYPQFNYTQQFLQRYKRAFVETADCQKLVEKDGIDMINYGIEVLSDGTEKYKGRFFESLQSVFMLLQKKRKAFKEKIAESLHSQYYESYHTLRRSRVDLLESSLIRLYSGNDIYKDLSSALSEHVCTTKSLSSKDRALAPYATALFATVLYWEDLMATRKKTYRGIGNVGDIANALKAYQKGKRIVLPQFTSSSDRREVSIGFLAPGTDKNIFLIIDNSKKSEWRPKDIHQYSEYPGESEFLYPPAAKFKVLSDPVKRTKLVGFIGGDKRTYYEIKLKLVGISFKHKMKRTVQKVCPWRKEN